MELQASRREWHRRSFDKVTTPKGAAISGLEKILSTTFVGHLAAAEQSIPRHADRDKTTTSAPPPTKLEAPSHGNPAVVTRTMWIRGAKRTTTTAVSRSSHYRPDQASSHAPACLQPPAPLHVAHLLQQAGGTALNTRSPHRSSVTEGHQDVRPVHLQLQPPHSPGRRSSSRRHRKAPPRHPCTASTMAEHRQPTRAAAEIPQEPADQVPPPPSLHGLCPAAGLGSRPSRPR